MMKQIHDERLKNDEANRLAMEKNSEALLASANAMRGMRGRGFFRGGKGGHHPPPWHDHPPPWHHHGRGGHPPHHRGRGHRGGRGWH